MKILFVDFDGTLTSDRYWRSLTKEKNDIVQRVFFGEDKTIVGEWMRGGYTAEEVNKIVAKALNMSYEKVWEIFVSDCQTIKISDELLRSLASLMQKYRTVLITGNMDSFTRFTIPALSLDEHFHHISNSFYEEIHKTDNDGELFSRWSEKLGIPLIDSILIDDQSKCCKIFERLGGMAYKTSSPEETERILKSLL